MERFLEGNDDDNWPKQHETHHFGPHVSFYYYFLVSMQNPHMCNVRGSCTKVGLLRGQCKQSNPLDFKM